MSPKVSIVIVSHGRPQLLRRCLESCAHQDYPNLQTVVLLNPPVPGQVDEIANQFPTIKIVQSHKNLGFFPALNLAIANADGEYVMTVDDDAYFLDNRLLSIFVEAFRKEPELGVVTCNIEGPHEAPYESQDRYVPAFKTGFGMIPRRVFTDSSLVGFYPDLFFRSAGETYLCTRLWDLGLRTKQLSVVGMHHGQVADGRSTKDWGFHGLRSQILCVLMREPWPYVPFHLASIFFRSFGQQLKWRRPLWWWAYAWWSAFINLPAALTHRTRIRWETLWLIRQLRSQAITEPAALKGSACS
jgi:GT2 family glycosyltransferase